MSSNIPSKPAYGVYISQLIRIGRICEDFSAFAERHNGFGTINYVLLSKRFLKITRTFFLSTKSVSVNIFMKASVYHLWLRIHSLGIHVFIVDIHDNCTM